MNFKTTSDEVWGWQRQCDCIRVRFQVDLRFSY